MQPDDDFNIDSPLFAYFCDVKNIQPILEKYQDAQKIKEITAILDKDTPVRLQLSGFAGAQDSFVLSGIYANNPKTHLVITFDKEEAAYLQNDLAAILTETKSLFFPDSFKRPGVFESFDKNNVLQRTEVVAKLSSDNNINPIIITYPEALFEKVVAPKELSKHKFDIIIGEEVDIEFLQEMLVDFGFKHENFVYEPGQFSIRGGIVDIFSYGSEWPYRIELFDEEIESIRTFDPTTQLSKTKENSVTLFPNVENQFTREQKVSLLEVLPADAIVWIKESSVLTHKLKACLTSVNDYIDSVREEEEWIKERAFFMPEKIWDDLNRFNLIFIDKTPENVKPDKKIVFQAKSQPVFNKNFKLLIDNLRDNTDNGITNHIFTENKKQIERFYAIFEDLEANVQFQPVNAAISRGFIDFDLKIACYTDHEIFGRFHKYKLRKGFTKDKALSLRMLHELQRGDFVTHIDHGIGRYSGLEKLTINGHTQESVRIIYKNNDVLYVSINALHKISKYVGKDGTIPKLHRLGSDTWKNLTRRTKRKVKDIAADLIKLYAQRKATKGHMFPPDDYLQNELEASFLYEDTPDQYQATQDVKEDMMKENPMDRLICGDVGFGKTEIAVRAAFKAVSDGKQVAILVPTTILALQHFKTFSERLDEFGVTVDYINRFRTAKEKRLIIERLKTGKIEIIIGTHGLLNKQIEFKDLGLLIIDEEQKFGVAAKEKIRGMKVNVDTLTLTATPIPRTLQFSLMAARDMSIIRTPPPNRHPIHTEVRVFNEELVKNAIYHEVNRGGQVFFVHNRVKSLPEITAMIKRLVPDVRVVMAHGQMDSKQLEKSLIDFIDGKYDVLVSTNIIETGLDIPNANTMLINNAHQFGLSDLHQLRGRIGRSNRKAYCFFFSPPLAVLSSDARKRLKTVEEFSDLGSGFEIAMRDLDIRGSGNMLGGEQSGFIANIGFDAYQKILEEAILELKETKFKELFKDDLNKKKEFVKDVVIDTDVEMHIPDDYVANVQERLRLYTEMDKLKDEESLNGFITSMEDRFGKVPNPVHELFEGLRVRWICKRLGIERVIIKSGTLRCFFIANQQSAFYDTDDFQNIMGYISTEGLKSGLQLKQTPKYLILLKEKVKMLKQARIILNLIAQNAFMEV